MEKLRRLICAPAKLSVYILVLLSLLFSLVAHAKDGSVSVFVLRAGTPVANAELVVEDNTFYTDEDGFGQLRLEPGNYVIQMYISDGTANLAFVKHPFPIAAVGNTRIIVKLNASNEVDTLDVAEPETSLATGATEQSGSARTESQVYGSLSGIVVSADNNSPVVDARVFLQGSGTEATSDTNGRFIIELPANTESTLSIVHPDYSAETLNELTVARGETITRTIELQTAGTELEEFVVLAPNLQGEIESIIEEQRNASAVAEVLGAEQFSKQGDSDAANALKRSTGLTLLDGRFVYVRGLGERYSTSQLNGLTLPSPEPTKRVVPLDMFPTSVVESIRIQKGWSADLPANFGGGNIDIRTRAAPDEPFAKASISTKLTSGATFSQLRLSQTAGRDRFGFDSVRELSDSTKDLVDRPGSPSLSETLELGPDLLKNPQNLRQSFTLPGIKLSASIGGARFRNPAIADKRRKLAWFGAYGYSQDADSGFKNNTVPTFLKTDTNQRERELVRLDSGETSETTSISYEHGGLFGLSYDIGLRHKFLLTNFYTNLADNNLTTAEFTKDGSNRVRYSSAWMERSLRITQLEGRSNFPNYNSAEASWAVQTGSAYANEPLSPLYQFSENNGSWRLLNDKIDFQNNELEDKLFQLRADLNYPFKLSSDAFSSVSTGVIFSTKDRDARSRRFSAKFRTSGVTFSEDELPTAIDTFTTDDLFRVNLTADDNESYTAKHDIRAFYGKVNLFPTVGTEVELGVRIEDSTQTAQSFDTREDATKLVSDEVLPQFNITHQLSEQMQIRGGVSKTVTRPDFREFSTSRFQDPETGDITFGNPFLSYTELTHYDLRFEWYLTDTDNLTLGAFAKKIVNPIETVIWRTDVNPLFTYLNAGDADLTGIEVGWFRELGHYSNRLRNWSLSGNLALTDSTIRIDQDLSGRIRPSLERSIGDDLTSLERRMQGQSPYVFNFTATYDSRTITASAIYNQIGKRIIGLGTEGNPDLYEHPASQLDFVFEYRLDNGLKFSTKLNNALDQVVEWRQGGGVIREFRKGRSLSLGVKYDF